MDQVAEASAEASTLVASAQSFESLGDRRKARHFYESACEVLLRVMDNPTSVAKRKELRELVEMMLLKAERLKLEETTAKALDLTPPNAVDTPNKQGPSPAAALSPVDTPNKQGPSPAAARSPTAPSFIPATSSAPSTPVVIAVPPSSHLSLPADGTAQLFWENRQVFVPHLGLAAPHVHRPGTGDGINRMGVRVGDPQNSSWTFAQCISKALSFASSTDLLPLDESQLYTKTLVEEFWADAECSAPAFSLTIHHPYLFQKLRKEQGFSLFASVASLPGSSAFQPLYELKSPGKSGSCFFFTEDMRFVIKTILGEEFLSADALTPHYYQHLRAVPNSLLCHVVGLYTLRIVGHRVSSATLEAVMRYSSGQAANDIYVVVMENLVPATKSVSEMYDLKGSKLGRTGGDGSIKKDLDVKRKLHMGLQDGVMLASALAADARFLARHEIMDYSLLLTIVPEEHGSQAQFCTCCGTPKSHFSCRSCALPICRACVPDARRGVCHLCHGLPTCPIRVSAAPKLYALPDEEDAPQVRSIFRRDDGGYLAKNLDGSPRETYYMGIIDWLQPFNGRKKAENAIKTLIQGADISVVEPPRYASRFYSFIASLIEPSVVPGQLNLVE